MHHYFENRVLVSLEGEQRLAARRIDAGDQRISGAVIAEHDGRAVADVSLLHGLADVVQGDRAVDVDQLAMLAQHIEELAEVGKRHCVFPNIVMAGHSRSKNGVASLAYV